MDMLQKVKLAKPVNKDYILTFFSQMHWEVISGDGATV